MQAFACEGDFDLDRHPIGCRHGEDKMQMNTMEETYSTVLAGGMKFITDVIEKKEKELNSRNVGHRTDTHGDDLLLESFLYCEICHNHSMVSWESYKSLPGIIRFFSKPQEYYLHMAATMKYLKCDWVVDEKEGGGAMKKRMNDNLMDIYDTLSRKRMKKEEVPSISADSKESLSEGVSESEDEIIMQSSNEDSSLEEDSSKEDSSDEDSSNEEKDEDEESSEEDE